MPVPASRIRVVQAAPPDPRGRYVLNWMVAARRTGWSFALDHAVDRARELGKPLLVFEPLRAGYRWASPRLHRFVIAGMADQARRLAASPAAYYPYVEPAPGAGRGLLEALAARAACVVTDEYPAFFLPRMLAAAGRRLRVRLEAVDGNGILPLGAAAKAFPTAHGFRRFLQRELAGLVLARPAAEPLLALPGGKAKGRLAALDPGLAPVLARWAPADLDALLAPGGLDRLGLDAAVAPVPEPGGPEAGRARLERFLATGLDRYAEQRNQVEDCPASGLSPYLHFGAVGAHQVLAGVLEAAGWSPDRLDPSVRGARQGYWGLGAGAEAFLDQLVTWRELGFNFAAHRPGELDAYWSLPAWALATLDRHRADPRPVVYDLEALEGARTHDPVWNAAQRQLTREGGIHNYLRMLWGKKILEWSPSPARAAEVLVELNDRFALDGRDPNSYAGIFWILGRYDRAWGPERPIFGTVRYMSSDSTRRKLRLGGYLARYGA